MALSVPTYVRTVLPLLLPSLTVVSWLAEGVLWLEFEHCHIEFHMYTHAPVPLHHFQVQHVTLRFRPESSEKVAQRPPITRHFVNAWSICKLDRLLAQFADLRSVIVESDTDALEQLKAVAGTSGVFGDESRTRSVTCLSAGIEAESSRMPVTPRPVQATLRNNTVSSVSYVLPSSAVRPISPFWTMKQYQSEWRRWLKSA